MRESGPKVEEAPQRAIISGRDGDCPSIFRREDVETGAFVQDKARRDIFQDKTASDRSSPGVLGDKGGIVRIQ